MNDTNNTNIDENEEVVEDIVETTEEGEALSAQDQVKKLREKLKMAVLSSYGRPAPSG